ncbi:MAG: bifunctional diaminohydroxyphosphoribosylaminopyrimidine deaminase/5-amino-6-(5-phosphoribosylamino)uracil reductase RibD [Gammaproteobacteria bacterium]|jgi:diaminohydroxyphosphoribosylaminopyrimidine deaminase/5-amino-6-(5-phosphoribosylamino)uracil reductase|nr:bifunctional diaminohydroxyphosphoribosylaminopyrimidine deaminase/5-amino-6-(5-phosphoribosylamino)uracil reductase RibD [Gammaproteobacteria bacterium]MBT3859307.1 bifunctional diaminohydroxyphosphoribosylaminopyrimidine deaminase/5-amino-6-(5-phosphoribosylamino)uracil reductase RibD [Gammaproteobacteria bacterium]MBT3987997.1 bifunctional diaminohydroxyphosphoribosylaminopyrimidine deaminase/5-amino-6-(5-phosphoribosylamino)uracil reductase RibD [Gammaproteobacteria bacterium]MBT4255391.1
MKSLPNNELGADQRDWPAYMQQALDLAASVISAVPNPRVGCVLFAENKVVGEGWHKAAGQDHAEVMALKQAGDKAKSSTAFVSLEPCAHTGRTGPCCDALIEAGISTVVIASVDPNSKVAGKGIERMEASGIEVFQLTDFDQLAKKINPGYFKRIAKGLPYVRCKMAMSLDGRTALANGESKWITSAEARSDVQKLRAASSAVVTGIGTVLEDDPSMAVRKGELGFSEEELERNSAALSVQPLRVIVDSRLRTPDAARIFEAEGNVIVFAQDQDGSEKNLAENVEIVKTGKGQQGLDLRFVLECLASDYSCSEVLVEAGSELSGSFIREGLVDELVIYIAPKILGSDAKGLLDISGLESLSESLNFEILDVEAIGSDIRVRAIPRN